MIRALGLALLLVPCRAGAVEGDVATFAGRGRAYGDGGPALTAAFSLPHGVAVSPTGVVYVADTYNSKIRRVDASGTIATLASDLWTERVLFAGAHVYADFYRVSEAGAVENTSLYLHLVASDGQELYRIQGQDLERLTNPAAASGVRLAVLGSTMPYQYLGYSDGKLYAVGEGPVEVYDLSTSQLSEAAAVPWGELRYPVSYAVDGGYLYVTESHPFPYAPTDPALNVHRIRRVSLADGAVTPFAGAEQGDRDGIGEAASFSFPQAVQAQGGHLYVADMFNQKIRRVRFSDGAVATVAGAGTGFEGLDRLAATFNQPINVVGDAEGSIYVAELGGQRILKIAPSGMVSALAGGQVAGDQDGVGSGARFRYPCHVAVDGQFLYVADFGTHKVRRVHRGTGEVTTLSGTGIAGYQDGSLAEAQFSFPWGIFARDGRVYVSDTGNHVIREIDLALGRVRTVAGTPGEEGFVNDIATAAKFNSPRGLSVHDSEVFVADSGNHVIRKIDLRTMEVTTVAGTPGVMGFQDDANPNMVRFLSPWGVSWDQASLYVADTGNNRIRKVDRTSGQTTSLAGTGAWGETDGAGASAEFRLPHGLFARPERGELLVADLDNGKIRRIEIPSWSPPQPPLPPTELTAQALPGLKVRLNWVPSASAGVAHHRVYVAKAGEAFDFYAPAASLGGTDAEWTAEGLIEGQTYRFVVRAATAQLEETNANEVTATAFTLRTCPAASIKVPNNGKKVAGNSLTVIAELEEGGAGQQGEVGAVLFQYRALIGATTLFVDVPARDPGNQPNPDLSAPYFVHWDISALKNGEYQLRALARCVDGGYPEDAPRITINVEQAQPDETEERVGDQQKKTAKVAQAASTRVALAHPDSPHQGELRLPAGAIDNAEDTLSVSWQAPAAGTAELSYATRVLARLEVTLASGQSRLGAPAVLAFRYDPVAAAGPPGSRLSVVYFDPASSAWTAVPSVVDPAGRRVSAALSHFSTYGLGLLAPAAAATLVDVRVYPSPYIPDDGVDDNGKPYSAADPTSGILFDNLTDEVKIEVFDVTGRKVWGSQTGMSNGRIQWDARNQDGREVASGVYFAVIRRGSDVVTRKLGVIR